MRLSAATLMVMIVFVLAAIIGAVALRNYLQQETVVAPPAPRQWAIAISDLPPGRVLEISDIGFIEEPELVRRLVASARQAAGDGELVLPAYIIERRDAEGNAVMDDQGNTVYDFNPPLNTIRETEFLVGRRVKENITMGSPYQASMFYSQGYRPPLTSELTDDRGLYQVAISNFQPGEQDLTNLRADVLFRNKRQDDVPGYEAIPEQTVLLVKDARIMEAGAPYFPNSSGGGSPESGFAGGNTERLLTDVTLAVSRDDGAKLMAAQNNGDLSLVLYGPESNQGTEISTEQNPQASVKLTDILEATPTPAPEIEIEPYDTIIFRGTSGFSNNSFSFDDLLRELAEVGAIEIKMDPQDNDLAANPARLTVPLNQPSNQGGGSGVNSASAALAGGVTGANIEPSSGIRAVTPTLPGGTSPGISPGGAGGSSSGGSGGGGGG